MERRPIAIARDPITRDTATHISTARLQASVWPVHCDLTVISREMGITGTADTTGETGAVAAVSVAEPGVVVGTAA
jgi:hypothetical protein